LRFLYRASVIETGAIICQVLVILKFHRAPLPRIGTFEYAPLIFYERTHLIVGRLLRPHTHNLDSLNALAIITGAIALTTAKLLYS
jgi:hypothetical protein